MERAEAIKKIRQMSLPKETMEILEALAPELKESEDERIRKFFAELATDACGGPGQEYYEELGLNYDKVMGWLEKQKDHFRDDTKMVEQKPAEWDEKDKKVYDYLKSGFEYASNNPNLLNSVLSGASDATIQDYRNFIDKLKILRPQPKQEWSEEDERMLERAIHIVAEYSDIDEKESEIVQNWLNKSLRPQPHWKPSEEELVALKRVGSILRDYGYGELAKIVLMIEGKLANLAVLNKSIWKPSEEQMEALNSIILTGSFTYVGQTQDLISLKDELKKL